MTNPAPCATLLGRLVLAIRECLENGICDRWIERIAREAITHLMAELVAHEQLSGRPLSLQEGLAFLTGAIEP
jgi:hypothetical protein